MYGLHTIVSSPSMYILLFFSLLTHTILTQIRPTQLLLWGQSQPLLWRQSGSILRTGSHRMSFSLLFFSFLLLFLCLSPANLTLYLCRPPTTTGGYAATPSIQLEAESLYNFSSLLVSAPSLLPLSLASYLSSSSPLLLLLLFTPSQPLISRFR